MKIINDARLRYYTVEFWKKIKAAIDAVSGRLRTIESSLSQKVDKVSGKGLSDENFTATEKQDLADMKSKMSGIQSGAEKNVQSDWNASSGAAFIKNKPTKVSQFTNDKGYLTSHQSLEDYRKKGEKIHAFDVITKLNYTSSPNTLDGELDSIHRQIKALKGTTENLSSVTTVKVLDKKPAVSECTANTIYMVKNSKTETDNLYVEYVCYMDGKTKKLEKLGDVKVNLEPLKGEISSLKSKVSTNTTNIAKKIDTTTADGRFVKNTDLTALTESEITSIINEVCNR